MISKNPSRPPNGGVDEAIYECSSPPCWLHEVEPSYLGMWTDSEVDAFLQGLLDMELAALADAEASTHLRYSRFSDAMLAVQLNHASCCVVLRKLIGPQGKHLTLPKFSPLHRNRQRQSPKRMVSVMRRHQAVLATAIKNALLKIFDCEIRDALAGIRKAHLDQFDQLKPLAA